MHLRHLFLPALALGGAALLLGPAPTSSGFSLLGTALGLPQRDFRVFNNFTDASANNNQTPDTQFPGHQGAVMAIWKACVEWGSGLHGTGDGDPSQPGDLGNGGANFDPAFAGEANAVGGTSDNIHSELSATDFGVFAFCEGPADNGWRIRYYQNWTWSDGPAFSTLGQADIQGIATHEYGHAVGLGHTASFGATMTAGTVTGSDQRDLAPDDIAGIKAIYGPKDAAKPRITSVSASGGTATIVGTGFSANDNEVWFASQVATDASGDPLVKVTGVASTLSGSLITVPIPDLAGKGDVLVKIVGSGHAALTNAFPFNGEGAGPSAPQISGFSPSSIEAVTPGPTQNVTITGSHFTQDVIVSVAGVPLAGIPSAYTFVDANTITVDLPLPAVLGPVSVEVANGFGSDTAQMSYHANPTPALQAGSGVEPVSFFSFSGLELTLGGTPGALFFVAFSPVDVPSVLPGIVTLEIGNNFSQLFQVGGPTVIGPAGWTKITIPSSPALVPLQTFFLEGITIEPVPSFPVPSSNKQAIQFLF